MVGRSRAPLPLNTSRPLDPFPLKQVTERVRDELTVTRVTQFDIVERAALRDPNPMGNRVAQSFEVDPGPALGLRNGRERPSTGKLAHV